MARLMRAAGLVGVCHPRKRRGQRPLPAPHDDLVQRRFTADDPDRLWCTDITEHPTGTGRVDCTAVLDVFTRKVVGWSIVDHMRSTLVVDALQMPIWRRQHAPGAIVHADHDSQDTFWIFGHRLREAGLLGSMGTRRILGGQHHDGELLVEHAARAVRPPVVVVSRGARLSDLRVDRRLLQPRRRHCGLGYRSPNQFEDRHTAATAAA